MQLFLGDIYAVQGKFADAARIYKKIGQPSRAMTMYTDLCMFDLAKVYSKNKWTDFDANWHKWSTGQGHKTVNFGGHKVKGQRHRRLKWTKLVNSISKMDEVILLQIGTKKGKGLDTCYSATYMSQTRDQQRFTISEVAADSHEPMVTQRIMWPSTARANRQLDPRCS